MRWGSLLVLLAALAGCDGELKGSPDAGRDRSFIPDVPGAGEAARPGDAALDQKKPTPKEAGSVDGGSKLPPGLTLKFQTDFETATKTGAMSIEIGCPCSFETEGAGGASIWLEGLDKTTSGFGCHSGSRCLGMDVTDISASRRNELNIYSSDVPNGGLKVELYVSEWLFLPSSFTVIDSPLGGYYDLFQVADEIKPDYCPMWSFMIGPEHSDGTFDLQLFVRDASCAKSVHQTASHFALPRGKWFRMEWYMKRHSTDGVIKAWIDGKTVFDAQSLSTTSSAARYILSTDIYYNKDDQSPHQMWVDDLAIYGS